MSGTVGGDLMKAIELKKITKKFGNTYANNKIDFSVQQGEIHCLLGENGAGKSTLVKIIFGLYQKDSGEIKINDQIVKLKGPADAIARKVGMIHQHFMLVDSLTITENIIAGAEPSSKGFINYREAERKVRDLSEQYNLQVKVDSLVGEISVGEQQRVEILKALYRNAEILILDEPTAVLTPQETKELFNVLEQLKKSGKTIIFITHKLKETMQVADRVSVLRDGKKVGTVETSQTNPAELARMMVGREVLLKVNRTQNNPGEKVLEISNLNYKNKKSGLSLEDINFSIQAGEILGIAGVEGNGQLELEEVIAGLRSFQQGNIELNSKIINNFSVKERRKNGLAHIPSDRLKRGLIQNFNLANNLVLGSEWDSPYAYYSILNYNEINKFKDEIVKEFDLRYTKNNSIAGELSGGNQQKLIIGRELSRETNFILAAQPTRGVDVGAIEYIHKLLIEMRNNGKAILLISAELDELRSLSDHLLVIYEGKIVARGSTDKFTEEELGLLMAGHYQQGGENV